MSCCCQWYCFSADVGVGQAAAGDADDDDSDDDFDDDDDDDVMMTSVGYHLVLSAKGAFSEPQPTTLVDPQRSDPKPSDPKRSDPKRSDPPQFSRVIAHLSRMNFPSLYFWLFSAASS